jgi:hypothetical protein
MPKSMYDFEQSMLFERSLKVSDIPISNKLFYEKAQLYMAVDGTRARLEERKRNAHLSPSVQGQNDGAWQVRAA